MQVRPPAAYPGSLAALAGTGARTRLRALRSQRAARPSCRRAVGYAATLGALTGGEQATLEQGIKMKAATDAKGMKPEGQLMSAKLQQDGHAENGMLTRAGALLHDRRVRQSRRVPATRSI